MSDLIGSAAMRSLCALGLTLPIFAPCANAAAAVAIAAEPARLSRTNDYPHKPIRVLDPFPAAGASDIIARLIGQKLTERYGQPIVMDNRPGAGGILAAELAAKATPDGYTLFDVVVLTLAPSLSLYPGANVDPLRDFAFISLYAGGSYALIALPSFAARTIPELVALARSQPGKIVYASSGIGSGVHLAGELLKRRAGIDLLHVPYKGAGPIMSAVVNGEVQLGLPSVAGALPLLKSNRVMAIAVTSAQRAKALPNVSTIAESGYPGYDLTPWYGVAAPAGTPPAIIAALNAEIGRILQLPDIQSALAVQGLDATASTPERFRTIVRDAIATSAKIIRDVGIKAE